MDEIVLYTLERCNTNSRSTVKRDIHAVNGKNEPSLRTIGSDPFMLVLHVVILYRYGTPLWNLYWLMTSKVLQEPTSPDSSPVLNQLTLCSELP